VSIYAAYLYDSVKLYAWALDQLLREDGRVLTDEVIFEVAQNGTAIIEAIRNRTYQSKSYCINKKKSISHFPTFPTGVTGATIKIDRNGDSEGNFSVLALKPFESWQHENLSCDLQMIQVAHFQQGEDDFPVSP
jgi:guanylate cyclase, other